VRVRRSLLNFGTVVLYTAVTTVVAIWSTPLLQGWLKAERFGAFRVVNEAFGYLTLLELGLGGALGPLLARAISLGDDRTLASTVSTGVRSYLKVSALTLAVGVCLTPVIPRFAVDLNPGEGADLRRAWLVALAAFGSLGLLPLRSVVEARQLGYVVNLLLTAQSLLVTGTALLLAWKGWGITGQAVALVVGSWAFNLALGVGVFRAHPGLFRAVVKEPPDPSARRAVRGLSWPTLLLNLSGRLGLMTDSLVIGWVLGARSVNSLFGTQRLAALGQTLLAAVGGAAWAGLAELHTRGERETFNRRLVELSRLVAVLAVSGLAPVVAYNRAFVTLWLGPDGPAFTYGGDAVILVASFNVFLVAQVALWTWCFTATGKIGRVVRQAFWGSLLNLATSVLLAYEFGLAGPLLGTAVAMTGVSLWALPHRLWTDFGTPPGRLAWAVAGPFLWGLALTAVLWWLARRFEPTTWPGLALAMGAPALLSLAFGALVLLTREERDLWRGRLRALRPPKGRDKVEAAA
jgi:O-antigen/teichoic acid export membrane protein